MKKRSVLLSVLVTMIAIAFVVTSCSTTGPAEKQSEPSTAPAGSEAVSQPEAEKKILIGYNAFGETVSFSKKVTDGLMESAKKAGITVVKADTNGDAATALKNVESFIAQGATVIVDSSWVVSAAEAVSKKCEEAGIPFISVDTPAEGAYFYGVNNLEAGKVTGRGAVDYINKNWDGRVDYIVLGYNEAIGEEVKKRCSGIVDAIREAGIDVPDDKVVFVNPQNSDGTIVSKQLGTDFLTAHPDAKKVLFGSFNEQVAQGFLSAIETSNRSKDCIVVSHGGDELGIANLKKENCWIGSTAYFPEKYGEYVVQMALDLSAGKDIDKEIYMETVFLDRNNYTQYYPD